MCQFESLVLFQQEKICKYMITIMNAYSCPIFFLCCSYIKVSIRINYNASQLSESALRFYSLRGSQHKSMCCHSFITGSLPQASEGPIILTRLTGISLQSQRASSSNFLLLFLQQILSVSVLLGLGIRTMPFFASVVLPT